MGKNVCLSAEMCVLGVGCTLNFEHWAIVPRPGEFQDCGLPLRVHH